MNLRYFDAVETLDGLWAVLQRKRDEVRQLERDMDDLTRSIEYQERVVAQYAGEGDVPSGTVVEVCQWKHEFDYPRDRVVRERFMAVVTGHPNIGKYTVKRLPVHAWSHDEFVFRSDVRVAEGF